MEITLDIARKVLDTVDAGLCLGQGQPIPGQMCVEAAVCYAMGLPPSDDPPCVSRALRAFKLILNDAPWSSNAARAYGLRNIAIAQLGSSGMDDVIFVKKLAEKTIRRVLPSIFRDLVAKYRPRANVLLGAADRCENEETMAAAMDAAAVARALAWAWAVAGRGAAAAAWSAASGASSEAVRANVAAGDATRAASWAVARVGAVAEAEAGAAAVRSAEAAARAAIEAEAAAARSAAGQKDFFLVLSAELAVEVLREMQVPGIALMDTLIPIPLSPSPKA